MPNSIEALFEELAGLGLTVEVLAAVGVGEYPGPTENHDSAIHDFRLRTSLYLAEIHRVDAYLTGTEGSAQWRGVAADEHVRDALRDPHLLARYCVIVDAFLIPGLSEDLSNDPPAGQRGQYSTMSNYFSRYVLNGNYERNVPAFFDKYPMTRHAVTRLTVNFNNNISEACRRVLADWRPLSTTFGQVLRLRSIKPMGNDFHKGGRQVLKLDFEPAAGQEEGDPSLLIMYKPSDVEADCLIMGDSAAVNNAYQEADQRDFMRESLMEIINDCIRAAPVFGWPFPGTALLELPTYRILPMAAGSSLNEEAGCIPIRESYGYIEYLGARNLRFGNDRAAGAGDCRLDSDAPEVVRRFYTLAGELVAIASTFSLIDLHMENVIAARFQPHLIDLEVCLTDAVAGVSATSLIKSVLGNPIGGINGTAKPFTVWQRNGEGGEYEYESTGQEEAVGNRLYGQNGQIPLDAGAILTGIEEMLWLLGGNVNRFDDWFRRLERVVVRYLPAATPAWLELRNSIYVYSVRAADAVDRRTEEEYTRHRETYTRDNARCAGATCPPPNFEAFNPVYTGQAMLDCDIPSYYRRIDERDIMDSTGRRVAIPASGVFERRDDLGLAEVNIGRNSFFAQNPLEVLVRPQLSTLATRKGFEKRTATLCRQVRELLNVSDSSFCVIL